MTSDVSTTLETEGGDVKVCRPVHRYTDEDKSSSSSAISSSDESKSTIHRSKKSKNRIVKRVPHLPPSAAYLKSPLSRREVTFEVSK